MAKLIEQPEQFKAELKKRSQQQISQQELTPSQHLDEIREEIKT